MLHEHTLVDTACCRSLGYISLRTTMGYRVDRLTEVIHVGWLLHEGHPSLFSETDVFTVPVLDNIQYDIFHNVLVTLTQIITERVGRRLPDNPVRRKCLSTWNGIEVWMLRQSADGL